MSVDSRSYMARFERLFKSPEYQQMLKDAREELERIDREAVERFLSVVRLGDTMQRDGTTGAP